MATGCHANNFQVRSTKATTKNLRSLIGPRNKPVTNGKIGALLPAGHQKQIRSRGNKFATNHQWGRPFCFRPIQGQQICDQSGAVVHQFEVGPAILFSAETQSKNRQKKGKKKKTIHRRRIFCFVFFVFVFPRTISRLFSPLNRFHFALQKKIKRRRVAVPKKKIRRTREKKRGENNRKEKQKNEERNDRCEWILMNRRVVTPSTPLNGRPVPISTHSYTHTHTHTH